MSSSIKRAFRAARSELRSVAGQASVEAAFLIPIVFLMLLLLIQPGIILYDRMVMQAAASEGCRLLATKTDAAGASEEKYESYILRRLGSIPPQDNFHIHGSACSWDIELVGSENTAFVEVTIRNKVKPLPLLDSGAKLLGLLDESGLLTIEVSVSMPTQPYWVSESAQGLDPRSWVDAHA